MVEPNPANYSIRNAAIRIGCGRSMVYEFIDQKLLRKIKLKSKTLIPAADVERLIRALHDGTLSVGKRQLRDGEAAKNAAHKERMRTRRAQDRAQRQATRVAP